MLTDLPEKPCTTICFDLIVPLTRARVVFIDKFTKWAELVTKSRRRRPYEVISGTDSRTFWGP